MKSKKTLWIGIIILVLIGLAIPKLFGSKPSKKMAGSGKRNMPVQVEAFVIKKQLLQEKYTLPGTIIASEEVQLRSEISGKITAIYFQEGSAVSKGKLLVKLYDSDIIAQKQKALANLNLAIDKEKRQRSLLEKEVISIEDYRTTQRELEASVADTALLNAQLRKTEIRAPFDGLIGIRLVSEGSFVNSGAVIADLVSTAPKKIEFSVPEKIAQRIRENEIVQFTIQGSTKSYSAEIFAINPKIDEASRTTKVRAQCDKESRDLISGLFCKVVLPISFDSSALVIPTQAILPDLAGSKVIKISGQKPSPTIVKTGIRSENNIEILTGINEGDTIALTGLQMIRPKSTIKIRSIRN